MTLDTKPHRHVQLLVVDPTGCLLLKRDDTLAPWRTLGGELSSDEDYPGAAIRLLHEDAGLACPLGPLLRQRTLAEVGGQQVEERFFLVRCPQVKDNDQSAQGELSLTASSAPRYQWWPLADMQRADAAEFSPSWLPELLASVLFSETIMPTSTARF